MTERALKRETLHAAIFVEHRSALIEYAAPILGCRARAEDVVQEAYIRFTQNQDTATRRIDRPVAYLYRIVRNLSFDWARRQSLEQARQSDERVWWMQPSQPRTPEQEALHRHQLDAVRRVLDGLPDESRVAVEMHRFGGYTMQEIAARLEVSVTKVHGLIQGAMLDVVRVLEETAGAGTDD